MRKSYKWPSEFSFLYLNLNPSDYTYMHFNLHAFCIGKFSLPKNEPYSLWNSKYFHKFHNYIYSVLWIWTLLEVYYYSCMFILLEKWREVKKQRENQYGWGPTTVSPTSPTLDLIGFGYPYLHTIFLLRLQFCRLSKTLGVLNEDGGYYCLEI